MSHRKKIDKVLLRYSHARATVKSERRRSRDADLLLEACESAQTIIQQTAKRVQEQSLLQISNVVTACLQAVFNNPYTFHILVERKRGRTEAKMQFKRNGKVFDPLRSTGGGVVDVAAFALRLSAIVLSRPKQRRLVILDEPFKHVSRNHTKRLRNLLVTLSQDLKVQFIIVTHNKRLVVGKVYTVSSDGTVQESEHLHS